MTDPVSRALDAAALHRAWAPALLAVAGAVTSVGPCAAPRCLMVAAFTGRNALYRWVWTLAFASGVALVFALAGIAGASTSRVASWSPWLYAALAIAMGAYGAAALWRGECRHGSERASRSAGAAFFLGAFSSCVVSPCCMPVAAGIVAIASASGGPWYGAVLLACFSAGHSLPLFAVAMGAGRASEVLQRFALAPASRLIGASLMLSLSLYYLVLA